MTIESPALISTPSSPTYGDWTHTLSCSVVGIYQATRSIGLRWYLTELSPWWSNPSQNIKLTWLVQSKSATISWDATSKILIHNLRRNSSRKQFSIRIFAWHVSVLLFHTSFEPLEIFVDSRSPKVLTHIFSIPKFSLNALILILPIIRFSTRSVLVSNSRYCFPQSCLWQLSEVSNWWQLINWADLQTLHR